MGSYARNGEILLVKLRHRLQKVLAEIEKLRADSEKAHSELRLEIEKVRAEITRSSHQQLKWQNATILGVTALLIRGFHLLVSEKPIHASFQPKSVLRRIAF